MSPEPLLDRALLRRAFDLLATKLARGHVVGEPPVCAEPWNTVRQEWNLQALAGTRT